MFTTEIYVNLIHYPLYVLGPGVRVGVWFQGCSIGCTDCIATHTWSVSDAYRTTTQAVFNDIMKLIGNTAAGLTISGGEPFDQSEALHDLLIRCRNYDVPDIPGASDTSGVSKVSGASGTCPPAGISDILLYTGYEYEQIREEHGNLLQLTDAIVTGPFVSGDETNYHWKGSGNQTLTVLSNDEKTMTTYESYRNTMNGKRQLQIVETNSGIQVLGIPSQRDAEALKRGID